MACHLRRVREREMLRVVCCGTSFEKSLMRNVGVCRMGGRPDVNSNLQVKGRKTTLQFLSVLKRKLVRRYSQVYVHSRIYWTRTESP